MSDPIDEVKTIVAIVIIATLMGLVGYLAYTKSLLETQVAEQQNDITALTDQNANFKSQAEAANAVITKMHDDDVARTAAAAKSISAADRQASVFEDAAKKIGIATATGDDCEATKTLLKNYYGGTK